TIGVSFSRADRSPPRQARRSRVTSSEAMAPVPSASPVISLVTSDYSQKIFRCLIVSSRRLRLDARKMQFDKAATEGSQVMKHLPACRVCATSVLLFLAISAKMMAQEPEPSAKNRPSKLLYNVIDLGPV